MNTFPERNNNGRKKNKNQMRLKKDFSLLVLILLVSVAILIGAVLASTTTFNVPSGEELTRNIDLNAEDHVTLTFTAIGGGTVDLHFYMVFPNGTTLDKGSITQFKTNFVSEMGGLFELHFVNNSSSTQLITLNYEIERYFSVFPP